VRLQTEHIFQALQRSQSITWQHRCLVHTQTAWDQGGIVCINDCILCVETTFRVSEFRSVHAVAFLKLFHIFTDRCDCACTVCSQHIGKLRCLAQHFHEPAFAFEWIPSADT